MTTLLHVSASPRGAASESLALADTFVNSLRESQPNLKVDTFDLWDGSLPEFGPAAAAAKMSVFAGEEPTGEEKAAWQAVQAMATRFTSADCYLFSVPMWNASVPYILKQFIDVVSQPGLVFSFDPDHGYTGLVTGKKAVVVYTGAVWGPERGPTFGSNFLHDYFEDWLRWAGVSEIDSVLFHPNLATDDADAGRRHAQARARELARTF